MPERLGSLEQGRMAKRSGSPHPDNVLRSRSRRVGRFPGRWSMFWRPATILRAPDESEVNQQFRMPYVEALSLVAQGRVFDAYDRTASRDQPGRSPWDQDFGATRRVNQSQEPIRSR